MITDTQRPAGRPAAPAADRRSAAPPDRKAAATTAPRIGLALPGGLAHWHDVHRGIADWAAAAGWHVLADLDESRPLAWWLRQPVNGLIAAVTTPAAARGVVAARIPLVNVAPAPAAAGLPTVAFDDESIGRLAADHLLERGYRQFGFFGLRADPCSGRRLAGFAARLDEFGVACTPFEAKAECDLAAEAATDGWLVGLPPGTGIFVVNDIRAQLLLDACRRLAVDVPGRIGVLGTGDFSGVCTALSPPLSSIRRNGHDLGRRAAEELARLFAAGRPPSPARVSVPPEGVSARASTAFGGGDLATRAVLYIRDHIGEAFDVGDLSRKLQVSRRSLERACQQAFGESPRMRLLRLRAEAAIAYRAARPAASLTAAAAAAGFSSVRHMHRTLAALGLG